MIKPLGSKVRNKVFLQNIKRKEKNGGKVRNISLQEISLAKYFRKNIGSCEGWERHDKL